MLRWLFLLLAWATVARAQPVPAPGTEPSLPDPVDPSAPVEPSSAPSQSVAPVPASSPAPAAAAGPAAPAPAPRAPATSAPATSVMDKRWAIGLSLGSQTLAPLIDNGQALAFAVVELSGRFRIRPRFELALALGGGGAMKGALSTGGVFVDLRYRFLAERELNVFGIAGLGVVSAARKEPTEIEKQGRGALRLGAGVEWRFSRSFAAEAELRFTGVGENPEVPAASPETLSYQVARYGLSGGAILLGGTFYF